MKYFPSPPTQAYRNNYLRTICITSAAATVLACFQMPAAYYTFLRLALFSTALTIIITEAKQKSDFQAVAFIAIAVLFNPIIPIYLYKKAIWIAIDIGTAMLYLEYGFRERNTN